jgi:hypothetical protein
MAGLGRAEDALTVLERAIESPAYHMIWIASDPVFDGVRDEARFEAVLRAMHL